MQNLTLEQQVTVKARLVSDRQWRRSERIGHVKRQLWLAHMSRDKSEIAICIAIYRALNYDYIDKVNHLAPK